MAFILPEGHFGLHKMDKKAGVVHRFGIDIGTNNKLSYIKKNSGIFMAVVKLLKIAHGRSGDKGNGSNVGIITRHPDIYPFLKEKLTPEVVKEHMKHVCKGKVERFELPNLGALNFLLHESLGGGGTVSLKLDAQGKTHASQVLRMDIEVPDELLSLVKD